MATMTRALIQGKRNSTAASDRPETGRRDNSMLASNTRSPPRLRTMWVARCSAGAEKRQSYCMSIGMNGET